jgi:hypothetical protein
MNELGTDHDTQFIVVGAKMDQPIERPSTVNLMGYDLRTIASIISNCDLFIGLDSGITHIASGFNVPIVDILFPALPQYWRPANGRHVVFSSRKVMRKFSAADDLDKEIVLKFCRLLIGENPLNGGTLVRFYPNMRKVVKRFFNHVLLRLSRSLI